MHFPDSGRRMRRIVFFLSCFLLCHCALRPVPRDLASYVNRDIYNITALEGTALKAYDMSTGGNYRSDQVLRNVLDTEVIPTYSRFVQLTGRIRPETIAVRDLHGIYRNAAGLRLQGFRTVLLALDTSDPDMIRQANRMLDQGQNLFRQWQEKVATMTRQYDLQLN